jgi:hypothetical protein
MCESKQLLAKIAAVAKINKEIMDGIDVDRISNRSVRTLFLFKYRMFLEFQ